MKAWGVKSPYGEIIEIHTSEGAAVRSAVLHHIHNGWDVDVVPVRVTEIKEE